MALTPTLPTGDSAGLSAASRRRIQAGMIARAADGTPRLGLLSQTAPVIVTGRASELGYDIAAFGTMVVSRAAGGVEFVANDGTYSLVPAGYAAPIANSRLDVIWVRSQFTELIDPGNVPLFGLTQGTASATPTKPAIPAGALELAVAEVKASDLTGSTVVVTNSYPLTAFVNGTVPFRSTAEMTAWTPAAGSTAINISDQRMYVRRVTGAAPSGVWLPDRASFFVNRSSAQSLSPAGWWGITTAFATPSINDLGTWTGASGTLQVTHAGIYRVSGFVKLNTPSNPMSMQITQNSGAPDVGVIVESFMNSSASSLNASAVVSLADGDVLRLLVFNSAVATVSMAQLSLELVTVT